MNELAALWVDHLFPDVPYRQYVLSFQNSMAVRLGYDVDLLGEVSRSLTRRLMRMVRRRVKREHRLGTVRNLPPGVIVVVQRFRSDLGLYVHFHCLVTDGAYEDQGFADPVFRELSQVRDAAHRLGQAARSGLRPHQGSRPAPAAVAACASPRL